MNDRRWSDYLHERHSPDQLRAWARRLAYFRFCRAYGGHSNDGDHLLVSLRVESLAALLRIMSVLDVPVKRLQQPSPGAFAMPRFPELAQPGHVRIAGHPAHVWSYAERLTISVADTDDLYSVTESAVAAAASIEVLLAPIAGLVVDPPQDDRNCVCPRYYPELWHASP